MWGTVSILALALASGEPKPTSEEPLLELRYETPPECPAASEFHREVEALAVDSPSSARQVAIWVRVEVREGEYFLSLESPAGKRELTGASCRDVTRAAALFVALLLEDPRYRDDVADASSSPSPRSSPERTTKPDQDDVPAAPRDIRFALGLVLGIETGLLPVPSPFGEVTVGLRSSRWMFEAQGHGLMWSRKTLDSAERIETNAWGGGLRGCFLPVVWQRGALGPCVGVLAGALFVRVSEIEDPNRAAPAFIHTELGGRLVTDFSARGALVFTAAWAQPLLRPDVYLREFEGERLVHRSSPALRASLGLLVSF